MGMFGGQDEDEEKSALRVRWTPAVVEGRHDAG